jgi:hypothetical protein
VIEVDVSPAAYNDWHIDGAVPWNVYTDLKDAAYRTVDRAEAAVSDAIGRPGTTLLDVRSAAEYQGERFWPSGGMEPGGRAGHRLVRAHLPAGPGPGPGLRRFLGRHTVLDIPGTVPGRPAPQRFKLQPALPGDRRRGGDTETLKAVLQEKPVITVVACRVGRGC